MTHFNMLLPGCHGYGSSYQAFLQPAAYLAPYCLLAAVALLCLGYFALLSLQGPLPLLTGSRIPGPIFLNFNLPGMLNASEIDDICPPS